MSNVPKLRFKEFSGEWEEKKLSSVGVITTGSTPSTSVSEYYNGERLFVSPADIQGNRYINNTKTTLTELGFTKGRKVVKGSVCFVCIGSTIGKVAQLTEDSLTNQQINCITANDKNFNDFVYSLLELKAPRIKLLAGEQAVPQINKSDFSKLKFILPSKQEQEKIASFITSVDTKIEQLRKKEELLKQYKKGVMQQIFSGDIRFKADDGSEFEDWEEKKLKEVTSKKSSNISANTLEENIGQYKIYGATGHLKNVDFYTEDKPYISIVKDGAGVGRVLLCDAQSSVLGTLDIIQNNQNMTLYFIYLLLSRIHFEKYIVGSTIPHIYYKDYSSEKVKVPCLEEQIKISDFLSSIDSKIEQVSTQLDSTKEFKKALLQQMFV